MTKFYCSECGAPAEVKKTKVIFDEETGKPTGKVHYLKCTAHRWRHFPRWGYERIENDN